MNEQLKIEITAATKEAETNIKRTKEEVEDFEKQTEAASKAADEALASIGNAAKTTMKAVAASVAAGAAALVGLAESTREYRNAQAKLNTAFEVAGSNAEVANQVYTELNGILGESDVAVEAANHLAKLTTNEQELADWTEICAGVYATFGDSLPIENLTEAANETAKTGTLTGGLADALNWAGIHEDEFQASLDECSNEQERQQLITKTLTKQYKYASEQFKKTNKDIIASNKATERWNAALAKMGGYVEPVMTDIKDLGASLLEDMQEPIKDIASYISNTFIPAVKSIISWIKENQPIIIAAGTAIAATMVGVKIAAYQAKLAEEGLTIATVIQTTAQKALNTAMAAAPYALIAAAIGTAIGALAAHSAEIEKEIEAARKLTEEQEALVESVNSTTEAINLQKQAYSESSGAITSEMEYVTKLTDELFKLTDETGRVQEAEQARAKFILNELNEALGTEYEMVGGQIQQYEMLQETIYKTIEAKKANLLLEEYQTKYVEAIKNQGTALGEVNKAYDAYMSQTDKAMEKIGEYNVELDEHRHWLETYTKTGNEAMMTYHAEEIERIEGLIEAEYEKTNKLKGAYDDAVANYATYTNDIERYENASQAILKENYNEAVEILASKGAIYGEYAATVDEETKQVLDTLYNEAIQTGVEAERIKANFKSGVAGYTADMVAEAEKAHNDAIKAWEDTYNEAHGIGGDMGEGLKNGLESKRTSLLDKAKSLISNIWNAMRKEADSHSPSRKTMALGGDMGAGLEIGLDKTKNNVVKSATEMVKGALIPMKASIEGVSWNNLNSIFTLSSFGLNSQNINAKINKDILPKDTNNATDSKPMVVQLVVDKKVLGEVSVSSINDITKQTGNVPLIIA